VQPECLMSSVASESDEPQQKPADTEVKSGGVPQQAATRESLWKAINGLPDDYKTVILLRQQLDLGFAEIAERMQRNPDAARVLWGKAILALGERFNEPES
jgi:DNA-directed RNA polymerase specialized sigma24 family protein